MPGSLIQWFPGHMAKTRRLIKENLQKVDLVIEILDARIPYSSKNPEIDRLTEGKPRLTLLAKASLADPAVCKLWEKDYESKGGKAIFCDFVTGYNVKNIVPAIREVLKEKLSRYSEKGMIGRALTAMVVGIPNVGKSTFINTLCGEKKAKAENRPGVTVAKQWLRTSYGVDLLDMPGVLWPKFEDQTVGESLAFTGAIKDEILNTDELAIALCGRLRTLYPNELCLRYKISKDEFSEDLTNFELLCLIGKKRGCLMAGGEINVDRVSNIVLDEFRAAKIGKLSLERP